MHTESEIEIAFKNFAFLSHRFTEGDGDAVQGAVDYMLTFHAVQEYRWAAFLATEEQIVRGIEAHLGYEYKGETIAKWYGETSRSERRVIFEAVSELCAQLRKHAG